MVSFGFLQKKSPERQVNLLIAKNPQKGFALDTYFWEMKWFYRLGIFIIRGLLPLAGWFNSKVLTFCKPQGGFLKKLGPLPI